MIKYLKSAARTVWADPGELPETVSRWITYLDLVQIIQAMGMRQMMFCTQYISPNEEVFETCMKDLILTLAQPVLLAVWQCCWPLRG